MVARYIGDAQWTALDADAKPTNAAVADTLTTLDTRRIFIHQGSAVWIEIGVGGGGGGTGGGGGFAAGGSIAKSGDGTSTVISIAHGLSPTPDLFYALPLNAAARGIISYGIDGTNINLTYPIAPAAGTNNLSYVWGAGYVNSASGGFTPTSTTTLTGKTISELTNNLGIVQPYTWIVYKASSTLYKAKSGITGLTPYSGTNLKTDIIDNIKFNPISYNHIHFMNADTPYDWPAAAGTSLDTGGNYYKISGESREGVNFRLLGATNGITISTRTYQTIENLTILIDQAAWANDAIRLTGFNGTVGYVNINNVRIWHHDGTGVRSQTGRGIVFVLAGANPAATWINIDNVLVDGCDTAIQVTTSAPTGSIWANDISIYRLVGVHCKSFCKVNIPVNGSLGADKWSFVNCGWQTTAVDATTDDMFNLDFTAASYRWWSIDNCFGWDFPANTTYLKANTNCSVHIKNGWPIGDAYMGGSGWDVANGKWNTGAHVTRENPQAVKYGATSVADGGTISHGLSVTPKVVVATGRVAGQIVTVTARSATTFTVAIKTDAGAAGTTQIVDWYAREYV